MGLSSSSTLPGLSTIDTPIGNLQQFGTSSVTTITLRGVSFDIMRYTPTGAQSPYLVLRAPKLNLASLMPAFSGTPLAALGELENVTFVFAPPSAPSTLPAPQSPANAQTRPSVLTDLQALARSNMAIQAGMNFSADLPLNGLGQELSGLIRAVGLNPATKLPLRGGIGTQVFAEIASNATTSQSTSMGSAAQIKTALTNAARTYGNDFLNNLNIVAAVPATKTIGPFSISDERFELKGDGQGGISVGLSAASLAAFNVAATDVLFSYDSDSRAVVAEGAVDLQSLSGVLTFRGLSFDSVALASTYQQTGWAFALQGSGKINGKDVSIAVASERTSENQTNVSARLTGGQGGITAQDVIGQNLPGFNQLGLTKIEVSGDKLVADFTFGPKKTPGEIAAFHVGNQTAPTLAFSIDKIAFGDLVPGAVGSALDGVEINGMSLVVVPQGGNGLRPDDSAVPAHIAANLKKVIADAATHDPSKTDHTLSAGFNLLADLDIQASQGMGDMMKSAGLTQSVMPIIGTISANTFAQSASKTDSLKGLDLTVALPDLRIPGLPDTIKITKPVFAVNETPPAALQGTSIGSRNPPSAGPFVTIGMDLQMQANQSTHDFDALLMTGQNAQGQRVINLLGSASDPKDLFEFKGLSVKTVELASAYDAGNWDFRLSGSADLNNSALTFDTEIKRVDGQIQYVATLDGGQDGISARDVAGRDIPGLDSVGLTKVEVNGRHLVADFVYGANKTPGELAAFHVGSQTSPTLAFSLDKLAFSELVPGSAGSALDGAEIDDMSLVVVPSGAAALDPGDGAVPQHISDNLKKVIADAATHDSSKANYALPAGFNLLADLDIKASQAIGGMMRSAGLTETVIPIVGTISASTFQTNAPKANSLKGLNLEVALPDLKVPALPDTMTIAKPVFAITDTEPAALTAAASGIAKGDLQVPFVTIGADLQMKSGDKTHDFAALMMTGKDSQGKNVIDLVGSATDPAGLFAFKGLSVSSLDLASVYDAGNWDFKLNGNAALNGAQVTFETDFQKVDGKTTYIATLSGGDSGISARDVAGRDVPGFDTVALTNVVVTGESLAADFIFGASKTGGEIAAFHPAGADHAVMAMTLDKLAFSDLVPETAGSPLDGVEIDELSLIVVPEKSAGLKPNDASIPAHIQTNLQKILTDANKGSDFSLARDINMFAELEIGASTAMQDLMSFIGRDGKAPLPIIGSMSRDLFSRTASKAQKLAGMNLGAPMPRLRLTGLPSAFALTNTEFKITDTTPKGNAGLWVGLQSDMAADLLGSKVDFKTDVGFAKGEISLSATSEQELKQPFGIKWVDLQNLDILLDFDKQAKSGELKFTAEPTKPFGKTTPKIEIDLKEDGGKLTAGVLKISEKVAFADLPILHQVKHADRFDFTFLDISTEGVSGGSELHGEQVDVAVFEHNSKWTFALSDNGGGQGFKFDRIMPALSKTPLKDFHLNDAALIFTQEDTTGKVSDMPEVGRQVLREIYGSSSAQVNLKNGITVAANFSPGASAGFAAKGLKGIGIHDDVLIEGTVEDIFGSGTPGVDIKVDINQGPGGGKGATHTPKMAKFPGKVGFFIQYKADELDVGLDADVLLTVPKKEQLELVTKLELELNEKGFAVDIFMDLAGQWKDPFGVRGIELDEVDIKFGIDMEGEALFGFKAVTVLGKGTEKIDIAAEMDFDLEAVGLPDGVAMKGTISDLGIPVIIEIAEQLAGGKSQISISNDLPLPEFRDVTFAFATPGVSDPQLGLIGSGFMLNGELFFLNRELGKVDLNAGKSGVKMDASIDPIDFKVIKLEKNTMNLDLGFKSLPKLEIDSEIEFLGAKQTVLAKFEKGMMNMTFEEKIGGGIWDSKFTLGLGVDAAHHDEPEIFVEGVIKEDFFAWLRNQAPQKVRQFFNELNAKLDKAKGKINNAEAVVRSWNSQIAAEKGRVQRQRANADAAVQRAESKVNSVRNDANRVHGTYEYHKHRCNWRHVGHCIQEGYYWGRYKVEMAAYHVAEGVLHAAQATVDHLPSELMDPKLDWLEVKQGAAMAALELAKGAINGVEDADRWIASGLASLLKAVGDSNALVVKEIFFEADLDGMIKGEPAILTMDLEVFGADLGTQMFAFKITDPVYDAEQLAFIPLHMVSELFEKHVPKSLKKLLGPVLIDINHAINKAEQKVYAELKNVPGLNLPADVKEMLESASVMYGDDAWMHAKMELHRRAVNTMLASNRHAETMNDAGLIRLAQLTTPVANDGGQPAAGAAGTSFENALPKDLDLSRNQDAHVSDRLKAFREKRKNLLVHMIARSKPLAEKLVNFEQQQLQERLAKENDEFVAYTDVHVPPGELFSERLLVARHAKLCLGQNGTGKTTFHPCSENPGGLLWSTKRVMIDTGGRIVQYTDALAKKWPNRVYSQLQHNGLCLTTPFHLEAYDQKARKEHQAQLVSIAQGHPSEQDAHLTLSACRTDGKGQLWKVVKDTHDESGVHGFKIQERDSAFCLRPSSVKANTKDKNKEVNGVFYPCTGIAHGTFELTVPNDSMPVWYDHNGVIKSDNGFCLDVPNDSSAAANETGSVVFLKECANDAYDRWDYVVLYDKSVKIINDYTGHCLYPYDKEEGAIPTAQAGQLVQRPCDARYGQGWKMRIIPKQKWFQLEAINSENKGTNQCMIADQRNPGDTQTNVYVKACNPQNRGRWAFDHWKGTYQWAEWTRSNSVTGGSEDLSSVYWISADSLQNDQKIGVCRVVIGNHDAANHAVYPGTWRGSQCSYFADGAVKTFDPSTTTNSNTIVEVLTGLDIGVSGATASWMASTAGVPTDTQGQNSIPPAPRYSAFLVGGDATHAATYLCRVNAGGLWHYGYQAQGLGCMTDAGANVRTNMEVLVFATVKNQATMN